METQSIKASNKQTLCISATATAQIDKLTNGTAGTLTILGASLIYSSMVTKKDCGGWKGENWESI